MQSRSVVAGPGVPVGKHCCLADHLLDDCRVDPSRVEAAGAASRPDSPDGRVTGGTGEIDPILLVASSASVHRLDLLLAEASQEVCVGSGTHTSPRSWIRHTPSGFDECRVHSGPRSERLRVGDLPPPPRPPETP